MTVLEELSSITGAKQKKDEEAPAFLKRLALKANDLKDPEWERLSEPTQLWVNAALDAVQKSKSIPVPPELEEAEASPKHITMGAETGKFKVQSPPAKEKKAKQKVAERGAFKNADTITLTSQDNPHREGSKDRVTYDKLTSGMTVEEALAAGVDRSYLRYIVRRELATIG